MKYIIYISLFLCMGVVAKAQLPSSTFPSRIFNGNTQASWIILDSPLVNKVLDTFNARYPGTQLVRIQGGDTAFWFGAGGHLWYRSLLSRDTISLSNRINLKLNITDTTGKWLAQSSRLVDTVYRVNDSTVGYTIKGSPYTFQILGRASGGGGGGSGTVTSVALSMPSAFAVSGSPITTSGTFNVSGAGTTAQYIRGNGTLATTDTGMIPNFYLKVRGLLSGTSPITFNQTTGLIGINNANTTGTKGAASFTSAFSDNGSGLIDLANIVSTGSCTNCSVTYNAKGQATAYSSGIAPSGSSVDTIFRTPGVDSIYYTINSVQYAIKDSTNPIITANNGLTKTSNNIQWGGALVQSTAVDGGASFISTFTATGGLTLRALNTSNGNAFYANTTGSGAAVTAQANTGNGLAASSVTQYGVSAVSTSNLGLYASTTSGISAGAFEVNPSSTNTSQTILQLKRYSSGTAANGIAGRIEFITEPSAGTADVTSGYIENGWEDATFATRKSFMGFYTVLNGTSSKVLNLASNGQVRLPLYPALTAQTDTTTYKPVAIDASGNVVKMIGWAGSGGGGSTPSWQQTLDVSPYHTSTLFYDTTMTANPGTHEWANYAPLVKTDTATNAFHQWQYSGTNNGSRNEVMFWGWNVGPGGGNYVPNRPAIGESWESNYQINPDGNSDRLMEKHEIYVTPAGFQHRLSSYTINTNTGTINYYHTIGSFALHNIDTHTPYYSISGFPSSTQVSWINSSNQSDYFSMNADFAQDVNTSALTFGSSTSKPVSLFNLSNFTLASFPDAGFTGKGYGGVGLSFGGETTGSLGRLIVDSSQTELENFTNVPIGFVVNGVSPMIMRKTKNNMAVPLIVNANDNPSAPFAALQSSANSSTLEAAGWFQQSSTASAYKYGIEVYANGSSGINEGLYVSAANGAGNRSIRIQSPSAGADNYAIYSDATAQSFFNGKVGLGNSSPTAYLHIAAGTATANTAPLKLTAGTNLTTPEDGAVEFDGTHYYGTIGSTRYQLDQQGGSATTIYNGDGTLLTDRNVASGGFTLRVAGANNSDTLVSIINTGTTSSGLYVSGTALGANIFSSSGSALQAIGSIRGAIITGDTDEGLLVKSNAVRGARIQTVPSSTNTVVEVLQLERGSSGGPGATGIGEYISFLNKTSTNSSDVCNTLISKFTDGTTATRTSQFVITGVNNASATNILTLDGDGSITTIGRRFMKVTTSSAGTLTLANSESYVFTGSSATTWTLPAVSSTSGLVYYIKNRGSAAITLGTAAAANELYTSSAVNTYTINAGEAIILISDGVYFNIN